MSRLEEDLRRLRTTQDEDLLRHIASRIMSDAVPATTPEGESSLFAACDRISAEAYEGSEARATLLLSARGHPSVDVVLEMRDPVPIRSIRAARKLLQLSRAGVVPLCDATAVWGLGRRVARPGAARDEPFEVRFCGRSRWEFCRGGDTLFAVESRRPMVPSEPLRRGVFEEAVRSVVGERDEQRIARLWRAVSSVVSTGCGATVVVSAHATAEAARLAPQGTPIAPRVLEDDVLQAVTGIGGAFLLDVEGVCHAIGVILDGVASAHGERARGSRFNSAANYVNGRGGTIAVVASDDGSVDVLPR